MRLRLTVRLADGRSLSGVYDHAGALARLDFARGLPGFVDFRLEPARGPVLCAIIKESKRSET